MGILPRTKYYFSFGFLNFDRLCLTIWFDDINPCVCCHISYFWKEIFTNGNYFCNLNKIGLPHLTLAINPCNFDLGNNLQ